MNFYTLGNRQRLPENDARHAKVTHMMTEYAKYAPAKDAGVTTNLLLHIDESIRIVWDQKTMCTDIAGFKRFLTTDAALFPQSRFLLNSMDYDPADRLSCRLYYGLPMAWRVYSFVFNNDTGKIVCIYIEDGPVLGLVKRFVNI